MSAAPVAAAPTSWSLVAELEGSNLEVLFRFTRRICPYPPPLILCGEDEAEAEADAEDVALLLASKASSSADGGASC